METLPPHALSHAICDYLGCNDSEQLNVDGASSLAPGGHAPATSFEESAHRSYVDPSMVLQCAEIDLTESRVVGNGAVGVVVSGKFRGREVAVKMLRDFVADQSVRGVRAKIARKDFELEMNIVSKSIRHPNIVESLGLSRSLDGSPMIVYEFVSGGTLEQMLSKKGMFGQSWRPKKDVALRWCQQLALALGYLHGRRPVIIHRDVKPSNILITHDMSTLKLTDLGLAAVRHDDENRRMTGQTGTHCFMAPEVYKDEGFYDEKVDIYSAAMVMWCIGTGRKPSDGKDEKIYSVLASLGVTPDLGLVKPSGLRAILTDAWAVNPGSRPSAMELAQRVEILIKERPGKIKKMCRSITKRFKISGKARQASVDVDCASEGLVESDADLDAEGVDIEALSFSGSFATLTSGQCSQETTVQQGEQTGWFGDIQQALGDETVEANDAEPDASQPSV